MGLDGQFAQQRWRAGHLGQKRKLPLGKPLPLTSKADIPNPTLYERTAVDSMIKSLALTIESQRLSAKMQTKADYVSVPTMEAR